MNRIVCVESPNAILFTKCDCDDNYSTVIIYFILSMFVLYSVESLNMLNEVCFIFLQMLASSDIDAKFTERQYMHYIYSIRYCSAFSTRQ